LNKIPKQRFSDRPDEETSAWR